MNHTTIISSLQSIVKVINNKWQAEKKLTLKPFTEEQIRSAVFFSDFSFVREGSADFFKVYDLASQYYSEIRSEIRNWTESADITPFEKEFIIGTTFISDAYVQYYKRWLQTMISSPVAKFLTKELSANAEETHKKVKVLGLLSPYTVITSTSDTVTWENLTQVLYAEYFEPEIQNIVSAFGRMRERVAPVAVADEERNMSKLLQEYVKALQCINLKEVDNFWRNVDVAWMNSTFWIQIVHDIESHYGDPLGVKIIPDFSVRFLNSDYASAQKSFKESQTVLEEYYTARSTPTSKKGLSALQNSQSGVYYLPFQTGMSTHFKFAGQSIPNRTDIRHEKGVKIYLDYDSTTARTEKAKLLADKVFGGQIKQYLGAVVAEQQMLDHVVPHEYGHTIYNIADFMPEVTERHSFALEELRADLNALFTVYQKYKKGLVDKRYAVNSVANYVVHELRRYDSWESTTQTAYRNSTLRLFKICLSVGILTVNKGEITLDLSTEKSIEFLVQAKALFETILAALDKKDIPVLDMIITEIEEMKNSELSKAILKKLAK